VIEANVKVI